MAARIAAFDWAATPLGSLDQWPHPLRFALDIVLASTFPTAIYWGPDLRLLYNDAWAPIPADRHPWALGRPGSEVWADIWHVVGPQMGAVMETGQGFAIFDQMLAMERDGRPQETFWNYSFTPIRDERGQVLGILNQGNETTRTVLAERARLAEVERMREIFAQAPGAVAMLHGPEHVIELANAAYLELVGNRDVVGKALAEALPEIVGQGFVALLDQVFVSGEAYRADGAQVLLERDGRTEMRMLDFVYQPVKDSNGNVTDIFVEATDVTERMHAEAALRRSEERLQLALDASTGVGTWEWDSKTGLVTGDQRFAKLFGIEEERVAAGGAFDAVVELIHPEDRELLRNAVSQAIAAQERMAVEYRVLRPNGALRWVLTQGSPAFDEAGLRRFSGVSLDITERRVAEESARTAAAELRQANEAQAFIYGLAERQRALDTPAAIMRLTAAALGRRLGVDRVGFYRVAGDTLQFGPCWTEGRLPPIGGERPVSMLAGLADGYRAGRTMTMRDSAAEYPGSEISRTSPAGLGVPLLRGGTWVATLYLNAAEPRDWRRDESAFVEAVAEISWDAVERAEAVQALKESEEQFRAIANSIDQMVWSTRPDGYHDYYNERWYEYTGVPEGSTDGEAWNGMFHPEDRDRAWSVWHSCLASGDPYRIEYRLRHQSGEYRWVLGRAQPVRDETGRITRWFGTCTDIQDIVDAREVLTRSREELERAVQERTFQLIRAEEQLRQAQKMESIGQLTGGIAHDFNNMLAVIMGALDLLERRLQQGNTDVTRYMTAARDGATRAAALTQRLLAFSRQQPLTPVAVDTNAMVSGMIELLTRTLGEEVAIETALSAGPCARADLNQLENVVLNLSVNARDAMPGGGTLTIATAEFDLDDEAARSWGLERGSYVEIAVSDTGMGMTPEVAARAFDPFFTTKGAGKGTGLGLSQVFGFVRQSGGHVRLESALGSGTTVHVYLPVHEGEAFRLEPAPELLGEAPRARPGETVLVVEDEERVRSFSVEALRELGYAVVDARDGPEALRLIEHGQTATLLFTDIVMPEMSGRELAERALAHIPGLKLLFTSGYSREDARAGNAGDVLAKPFDLDTLAVRVREALDS